MAIASAIRLIFLCVELANTMHIKSLIIFQGINSPLVAQFHIPIETDHRMKNFDSSIQV